MPTNKQIREALAIARDSVTYLYRQSGNLYPARYEYSVLDRDKDLWFPQPPRPYYQQLRCMNWDIAEDAALQLASRELHDGIRHAAEYAKDGYSYSKPKRGNLGKVRYLLRIANG